MKALYYYEVKIIVEVLRSVVYTTISLMQKEVLPFWGKKKRFTEAKRVFTK